MLLKSKSLLVVIGLAIVCVAGGVFLVSQNTSVDTTFAQSGYVLGDKVENEEGGYSTVQVPFNSGTTYQTNYQNNKLSFQSNAGDAEAKVTVDDYGFVHYEDGSASALKPGVMLDLGQLTPNDMAAYNINPGTTVASSGSNYSIEHMGESIPLDSVLWKLSANKMMIMGSDLSLQLAEGEPYTFTDYVEVTYIDDGVVQVSDAENTVLTISPVAQLTVNGGPIIDLYNRVAANDQAQLPLNNLLVGNEDNVDITEVEKEALEAVTIPTFTVIQGRDGTSGEPGRGGDAGASGENGAAGSEGASGSSGIGVEDDGEEEDDEEGGGSQHQVEQFIKPIFELPTFQWDSNSFEAHVIIKDDEGVLYPDPVSQTSQVTLRVIDVATGAPVSPTPIVNANDGKLGSADDPWVFKSTEESIQLSPNRTYKLIISAPYVVTSSGAEEIYWADFITKTFTTDGLGLTLATTKVDDTNLTVNLRKEDFSKAYSAVLRLYDEAGYALYQGDPQGNHYLRESQMLQQGVSYSDPTGYSQTFDAGDNFYTFDNLAANTKYYVVVENITMSNSDGGTYNAANYHLETDVKTRKNVSDLATPGALGAPKVFANKPNMTISAQAGSIPASIPPTAITNYRYVFAEWNSGSNSAGPELLTLDSQTTGPVLAKVSSANPVPPSMLALNTPYVVKLIIDVNDNVDIIEYESLWSEPVGMFGSGFPTVLWTPNPQPVDPPAYESTAGNLTVDPNGTIVKVGPTHPLEISLQSAKTAQRVTKTINAQPNNDIPADLTTTRNEFDVPLDQNGLEANTAYTCTVWAYCDLDGTSTYQNVPIGTFSIQTTNANPVDLHMKALVDPAQSFAVGLWLDDNSSTLPFAYEANRILNVKLDLYLGVLNLNAENQPNREPYKSVTLTVNPGNTPPADDSSLKRYLYTAQADVTVPADNSPDWREATAPQPTGQPTGFLKITEDTFGLSQGELTDPTLTLMVSAIEDYTAARSDSQYFVNRFTLINAEVGMRSPQGNYPNNGIDLMVGQTAPAPPPNGDGFTAGNNNIKEGDRYFHLPNQREDTGSFDLIGTAAVRTGYDPQTDVGMIARATFPFANKVDSFTYTLWRTRTAGTDYNSEFIHTAADSPLYDELSDPYREKVTEVVLKPYNPQGNDYRVPILKVGFGTGTDVLPSDNWGGLPENNNRESYQIYLAGTTTAGGATNRAVGTQPGQMASATLGSDGGFWNDEADGRGYHYYFTYTANLSTWLGGGSPWTWPNQYTDPSSSIDYSTYQVTSRRISAPLQAPDFKLFPWTSTDSTEEWKYQLNLLDSGVLTDASGVSIYTNQLTLTNPDNNYTQNLSVSAVSGTYNSLTFGATPPALGLKPGSEYVVNYYQKLWRHNGVGVPSEEALLSRYHHGIIPASSFSSDVGATRLYTNSTKNTVNIIWDSVTANQSLLAHIAGVEVKAYVYQRGASNWSDYATAAYKWSKIVPMRMDVAEPTVSSFTRAASEITLADLKEAGFLPSDNVTIETRVIFDTGTSGYGSYGADGSTDTTNTNMFLLQTQAADLPNSDDYYLPGATAGSFSASSGSPANGIYASRAGIQTTSQTVAAGKSAQFSSANQQFTYNSVFRTNFFGTLNLDFDKGGARPRNSATYLTAKLLDYTTPTSSNFTMQAMIPQVSNYNAPAEATTAKVQFRLDGATAPNPLASSSLGNDIGRYRILLFDVDGSTLYSRAPGDPILDLGTRIVDNDNHPIYSTTSGDEGLQAKEGQLNEFTIRDLEPGHTYKFRIFGDFTSEIVGALPAPTHTTSDPQYFFYDVAQGAAGREYFITTLGNVVIGGLHNDFYAELDIRSYSDKGVAFHYSLSTVRGFKIYYTITDTTQGADHTPQTIESPAGSYVPSMVDYLPIGGQNPSYNDFLIPGHSYSIKIGAWAGGQLLGNELTSNFTLRNLREPTFILTASPYWDTAEVSANKSKIALTAAINDPDKVVVDSQAWVKAWPSTNDGSAPLYQATFNAAGTPTFIGTVAGVGVTPGTEYTAGLYAAVNLQNEFPYTGDTPGTGANWPTNVAFLAPFEQRTVNVEAVAADTVLPGAVGVAAGPGNTVQLTFDGSVNLNSGTTPQLRFAIVPLAGGAAYPLTTIPFNPAEPQGISGYKTFTLLESNGTTPVNISASGKYYIQYSILLPNGSVLPAPGGSGTLLYVKS
jgi:hypothetical protein